VEHLFQRVQTFHLFHFCARNLTDLTNPGKYKKRALGNFRTPITVAFFGFLQFANFFCALQALLAFYFLKNPVKPKN
jgi:hypothetical protein